jgi:hypothetical protein
VHAVHVSPAKLPAAQLVHAEAPLPATVPSGHTVQFAVAPAVALYVPAPHVVHRVAALAEAKLPAPQVVQTEA